MKGHALALSMGDKSYIVKNKKVAQSNQQRKGCQMIILNFTFSHSAPPLKSERERESLNLSDLNFDIFIVILTFKYM